mgnify:CR=1 FL=1
MYEYVTGKAMWANITTPNTRFGDPKYQITVLTDEDTASSLEAMGLSQVNLSMTNLLFLSVEKSM